MTAEPLAFGLARIGTSVLGFPLESMSEVCRLTGSHPLMVGSSLILGGLDLRGHLIPVLDLQALCGFPSSERGGFAVIARHGDRLLAFPVDEVLGICRVEPHRIQALSPGDGCETCVQSAFLDGDRSVSIIGLDAIFARPGVLSVEAPQVAQSRGFDSGRIPMLIFEVGGAKFSIEAEEVYGTVPRQVIEVNAMTSGHCMGSITYHKRRVPVLSSSVVLGIGTHRDRVQTEVVVLRCSEERLIGLAVDAILDVRGVDPDQFMRIPRAVGICGGYFSGVFLREDGSQIYTISARTFLADPQIAAIVGLSTKVDQAAGSRIGTSATLGEAERYLVFKAGRIFATPLAQVSCILQPPAAVVPVTQPSGGFEGFFTRLRDTVPLVDLNTRLGEARQSTGLERVLLIGEGEGQLGFRVKRVLSIEASSWALKGLDTYGEGAEPLVQLGRGSERRALPMLDLAGLAGQYFEPGLQ